jgi:hypothetical protein
MCAVGDECVEMLSSRSPVARKQYRCDECGRDIGIGERYQRDAYVFDGYFYDHIACGHCVAARRWLEVVCNGWVFGGVLADLSDHLAESWATSAMLVRVVRYSRRRWRRHDGGLVDVAEVKEWVGEASARALAVMDSKDPYRLAGT